MLWYEYPTVAERFDSKVDRSGDCHLWTGSKAGGRKSIYGVFRLSWPVRRHEYAHRLSLVRKLGRELAQGEECLHSCDVHSCVNPAHLSAGSRQQNVAEATRRGRVMRGERHVFARLTERNIREIMALLAVSGLRHEDIASRYGVSRATVTNIKNGKTWRHITSPAVR